MQVATLVIMSSAYSQDLRQRVLAALDGGMSKMVVHRTFGVSRSTLDDWLQLRERTGSVLPARYKRGPTPLLADAVALRAFADCHGDSTMVEMAQAWHHDTGVRVSASTFSLSLRRLGYTRKKRASFSANDEKTSEPPGSNNSL